MPAQRFKRHLRSMERSMHRATTRWGQTVVWYEFDIASVEDTDSADAGTTYDTDLYDEGGPQIAGGLSRKWKAGRVIQVYQAILSEGEQQFGDQGSYMVDRLELVIPAQNLIQAGISQPVDRGAHVNDRVEFDGRLFSVDAYTPRGRIADATHLTVTVLCLEVMADEQLTDDTSWHAVS